MMPCGIVGYYREEPLSSTFVVQDYGSITRWCRRWEQHNVGKEHVV